MSSLIQSLDRHFYPQSSRRWDDCLFRERVLAHLRAEHTMLDLGAGRGRIPEMNFRRIVALVCGLDPDESVLRNQNLDQARVGVAEKIPWPDANFDVVFSDNVFEHLPDPMAAFREVYRVLKPGGYFFIKTPNRFHYVPLASSLTPHRFHQWFNAKRETESRDTFPTLYRANTRRRLRYLARATGFEVVEITPVEGRPEYLRFNPLMYACGIVYERAVNAAKSLSCFRVVLMSTFRTPQAH
jgi:SAM-dependent methyltransferase